MTQLQEADTISKLVIYANDVTGTLLLSLFVWSTFFILLMVLKRYDFDEALLVASMTSFVMAMILNYIELIPLMMALVFLFMGAATAFYSFVIKK